jgi:hypothetical protein
MAGFIDRFSNNENKLSMSSALRRLSSLGMKIDDMVIKQSRAIGVTEAQLGGQDVSSKDLMYALALADTSQKKYIPIFDKDYPTRRDFLRKFALNAEIDWMITTVSDEAICYDDTNYFCYPSVSQLDLKKDIAEDLDRYFKQIYNRFNFADDLTAWQYFRQFLIDGVLAFEIVYDAKGDNVIGFKELDPAKMQSDVKNENGIFKKVWYLYPNEPSMTRMLYDTQVIYLSYARGNLPSRISYVEPLVRSFNLLRIVENAQVMWMLMNSTWRLKMVVPVGSKSPQKARESLGEMMALYKEDVRIDPTSGELSVGGQPTMQYYKNYLFPSKNGEHVDIETLQGSGPEISESSLIEYFKDKLKEDSKIPLLRFDKPTNGGQLTGTAASGVDREEIRFHKFISRLRSAFQEILIKPLWVQMCLKHPQLESDEMFRSSLGLSFIQDNIFEEIRRQEILTKRTELISALQQIQEGDQPYFNTNWLVRTYLKLDPTEIENNKKAKEKFAKEQAAKEAGEGGEEDAGEGGGLGF